MYYLKQDHILFINITFCLQSGATNLTSEASEAILSATSEEEGGCGAAMIVVNLTIQSTQRPIRAG